VEEARLDHPSTQLDELAPRNEKGSWMAKGVGGVSLRSLGIAAKNFRWSSLR
jgi:hypothetical protein